MQDASSSQVLKSKVRIHSKHLAYLRIRKLKRWCEFIVRDELHMDIDKVWN